MANGITHTIPYQIVSKRNHLVLDQNMVGREGYRVTFTWEGGNQDYVDVLRTDFNAETVHKMIQEVIAQHELIGVQGEVTP